MYVRQLKITNLRCFRDALLKLRSPDRDSGLRYPNVNLLLGNNGAGKTTALKAIALGALAPIIQQSGFVPYYLLRRESGNFTSGDIGEVFSFLEIHRQDWEPGSSYRGASQRVPTTTRVTLVRIHTTEVLQSEPPEPRVWDAIFDERSPAFFVVGYGAGRRVEEPENFDRGSRRKNRHLRYQRVAGLFEEHVTLAPMASWLPAMRAESRSRYAEVISLLNDLLPDDCRVLDTVPEGDEEFADDLLFLHRGKTIPFGALSDGYRAYVGWVADLLYHMTGTAPEGQPLRALRGVVLVDEVDLHLHPDWQRTVVPRLSRALPNLQFVFSTHSPIVAGTLEAANIFVMEEDEDGATTIRQYEERVHGLSADQILESSYFNLETTRAPDAVDELRELSVRAEEGDPDAAYEFLKRLSGGTGAEAEAPHSGVWRRRGGSGVEAGAEAGAETEADTPRSGEHR